MKLLIVDDDASIVAAVGVGLQARWPDAEIHNACDGAEALAHIEREDFDLVVLDVQMPKMNGLQLLELIRERGNTPVLLLTGQGEDRQRVNGIESGADDYLVKPFRQQELAARAKALMRRAGVPMPEDQPPTFQAGDLLIQFSTHEVSLDGERIHLTPTEYRLLHQLASHAGRVLTFRELLTSVWGPGYVDDLNSLKIYVSRLRKKLHDEPQRPRYVVTERNVGYGFPVRGVVDKG